jgi:hypothetical protein
MRLLPWQQLLSQLLFQSGIRSPIQIVRPSPKPIFLNIYLLYAKHSYGIAHHIWG